MKLNRSTAYFISKNLLFLTSSTCKACASLLGQLKIIKLPIPLGSHKERCSTDATRCQTETDDSHEVQQFQTKRIAETVEILDGRRPTKSTIKNILLKTYGFNHLKKIF